MIDDDTVAVYNRQASEYAEKFERAEPEPALVRFIEHVVPGGHVLDLGCGPAFASAVMRDHGLDVDPVDASSAMVQLANERFGIGARLASFDDITTLETYDGIWAHFSLLHAKEADLDRILHALAAALKSTGVLHIGMKTGSGGVRDRLGRFYTYYEEADLIRRLGAAGFQVVARDTGEDRGLAGDLSPWVELLSVLRG